MINDNKKAKEMKIFVNICVLSHVKYDRIIWKIGFMEEKMDIRQEIEELKKEKDAVILAHYYVRPEIQEIADHTGDSFYLAQAAEKLENRIIVFAGVYFMGESAAILNPDKKVLMPDITADCAMAHMASPEAIEDMRKQYEDLAVVCYINSSAELKACSDVCVTSSNALKIVESLPNKNKFCIPDKNLGLFIADKLPDKHFIFNDGFCPIHEKMKAEEVKELKELHPSTKILAHPECNELICGMADYIGSTAGIIKYASESSDAEFIICTENGVSYELLKNSPDKKFYFPHTEPVCMDMKLITLEKIRDVLKTENNVVTVEGDISERAKKPLLMMLKLGR